MGIKKKPRFLRRKWRAYSKLGKGRKKKQVWRRPTGRDNKMREKRKGRPATVSIGYGKGKYKIKSVVINTVGELEKMNKNQKIILGKIGKKKKLEISIFFSFAIFAISSFFFFPIILGKIGKKKKLEMAKMAKEKNIEISNLNIKKFLRKNEKVKGEKQNKAVK